MPHLSWIDDNASTTSSAAGLTRVERLENRQRLAAAAQEALILVKNPTEVSSALSAGGSPGVRSRGRSSRLSKLNKEYYESEDVGIIVFPLN